MELGADIPGDLLTALRELRVSPKDFVAANYGAFSENLSKFLSSIIFITKPVCDAGEGQLSLSDAAYTLYNSGTIWGKFVDHTAMQCRQLDEMVLATIDDPKANAGEKSDKTDGRKKARRAHIHPLAVPLDDFKAGNAFFVESVKNSKRLEHKFALPKIVQLPQDRYLAEAQPSSLGLMQIEKIRSYVDDRGNKGNDWAAFRINTMKLSKEGYFPIEAIHPEEYHVRGGQEIPAYIYPVDDRPRPTLSNMDMDNLAHVSFGGPSFHHDDPMNALYEAPVPEAEAVDNGQFPVADVVAMPPPAPPPVARVSRGRPNRPNPFPLLPNKKNLSIGEEIDLRSLRDAVVAPSAANLEATPFRRRTRRILRKKEVPYQNAEVAFFQNFWTIPVDEPDGITCRIADVVRRFHLRLRCIQVPRRKRGRTEMEIMYVSQTSGREIPFGGNDVPTLNFPASPVRAPEQGDDAEYIETDEPLGMDGPLFDAPESLQADNAQFEQMVRRGEFLSARKGARDVLVESDGWHYVDPQDQTANTSRIVEVDLCDWEERLGEFLRHHEPNTLAFNLDEFEKELVVDCHKNFHDDRQSLSSVVRRRTTGEVCRSFLSVLDLANKSVVVVDRDEPVSGMLSSQGVDDVMFRLRIGSSEVGRFCGGNRKTEIVPVVEEVEDEIMDEESIRSF